MSKEEDLSRSSEEEQKENRDGGSEAALALEEMQARLEEAERERAQFKAMAQRAQADMLNYRQRVEKEREATYRSILERAVRNLLPVVDDLQLALQHAPSNSEEASWFEGVRLVERRLLTLLQTEGVTQIKAEGVPFNPWEHEALFTIETSENEPGTVVHVIRPGYKFHDKVLRAAQVGVTRSPHQGEDQPHPQTEGAEGNRKEKEEH